MVSKMRTQRIADRIREELSEILLQEVSDPRLVGVSVTDVTVDRELAYAEVYVSALEGSERSGEILAGLEHAQGYLRRELAHRVDLRQFPRLRFHWDPTFERAEAIEQLITTLQKEEALQNPEAGKSSESQNDEAGEANEEKEDHVDE